LENESRREGLKVKVGSSVRGVSFSPDNRRLAGAFNDGRVRVWDLATGQEVFAVQAAPITANPHGFSMILATFSPDGKYLASWGETEQTIQLWDAQTGKSVRTLRGHTSWVAGAAFSPDGRRIAAGGKSLQVWNATPLPRTEPER